MMEAEGRPHDVGQMTGPPVPPKRVGGARPLTMMQPYPKLQTISNPTNSHIMTSNTSNASQLPPPPRPIRQTADDASVSAPSSRPPVPIGAPKKQLRIDIPTHTPTPPPHSHSPASPTYAKSPPSSPLGSKAFSPRFPESQGEDSTSREPAVLPTSPKRVMIMTPTETKPAPPSTPTNRRSSFQKHLSAPLNSQAGITKDPRNPQDNYVPTNRGSSGKKYALLSPNGPCPGDFVSMPTQRPSRPPAGLGTEGKINWDELNASMGKLPFKGDEWTSGYGSFETFLNVMREESARAGNSIFGTLPQVATLGRNSTLRRSLSVNFSPNSLLKNG